MTLLHLDTHDISDYGAISLRTKHEYAARWNFGVIAVRGRIAQDRPASWSKILLCRDALDRCEWVWWLDADAAITNPAIDVRQHCDDSADIVMTKDANGINAGSFLLRNSDGARRLLDAAWSRTEFINHPWWEQAAIRAVIEADPYIRVKIINQRTINSYPENWQQGDLVVHFAGKTDRSAWFRAYPPFPSPVSIDECHGDLLYGCAVSHKPRRLLEIGIGSGYATEILLNAIRYNGIGELTCVDNFVDWRGKIPPHIKMMNGSVNLMVQDEGEFLRACPDNSYDLIVSDADHTRAGEWVDEYFRVANDGAMLFFHDTANAEFPGLRKIVKAVNGMPNHQFTQSSRKGERCERGWLWAVNRKSQ